MIFLGYCISIEEVQCFCLDLGLLLFPPSSFKDWGFIFKALFHLELILTRVRDTVPSFHLWISSFPSTICANMFSDFCWKTDECSCMVLFLISSYGSIVLRPLLCCYPALRQFLQWEGSNPLASRILNARTTTKLCSKQLLKIRFDYLHVWIKSCSTTMGPFILHVAFSGGSGLIRG